MKHQTNLWRSSLLALFTGILSACSELPISPTAAREAHDPVTSTVPMPQPSGTLVNTFATTSRAQADIAAASERRVIVGNVHTAPWAYHTGSQTPERWYISLIRTTSASATYSLGPFD